MSEENELPKVYDPQIAEEKWYKIWEENRYFKPVERVEGKGPYTILMPPPNVTGKLHMGHALNHTLIDTLIRFKRMQGYETLWIPGQDHAGIATQAKVEQKIFKEEGKTKHDLGREKFLEEVWKWKDEYGEHILNQFKKLGDSCDWDYFTFTMDDGPVEAVREYFVDLYNEGLIYQSDYIINWDPVLQSAISDAEVEHKEINGHFYHIHYRVKDSNQVLEIATTRPETLFGDTAVAVNPNDDRFEHLIGKMAIIPICNREVPIVADPHVDMEKGTGCLKVTPGHDFNDYEIGKRHDLPIINILNKDGTINSEAQEIAGLTVKEARKKTIQLLKECEQFVKEEQHVQQVGHSQRSNAVVEPMVSKQWFLNTEEMAKRSVEAVEKDEMKFVPKGWENTYYSYQRNPRPWCISRQLWWGHQIPVFACDKCEHQWADKVEQPESCPKCQATEITQDPDVLDTWFSSGIFPMSTLGWPNKERMAQKGFEKFYPSDTLVTAFDIIFFWVARMMMMNEKVTKQVPFKDTYIHAIVRDKDGKKMSKSLGNVMDPLDLIQETGCDAMRFTLAVSSGYNRNINLDPAKIEGYRNFINKLWNAFRFIHPHLAGASEKAIDLDQLHHHEKWILAELNSVTKTVTESFDDYRFDDACNAIYQFVYEKFCSWFIELSKGILNSENAGLKSQRANVLKLCFREIVKLLHPVIPFLTEELWQHLKNTDEELLIIQKYPEHNSKYEFQNDVEKMDKFIELVTSIRNLRNSVQIKPQEEIEIRLFTNDEELAKYFYTSRGFLKELANVRAGHIKDKDESRPEKSIMKATAQTEIFVPLEGVVNLDEFIDRLKKDKDKTQKEFDKVSKKLSNPKFAENAPEDVVAKVKAEADEFKEKLTSIENSLTQFQG
ncbi:MAG: valine--tRNA ligase [Halobacteriovoraceae bacterium]|nr:valine--tRNA ligase [Halobacteriovoraceae bacterium]|tara:strand:- start:5823 stop:8495 length:2673 start_codon:yes stop_codon:yes gene_type:complete